MSTPVSEMHRAIRQELDTLADPDRAAQQQAYMKSAMPYAGLTAPVLRKMVKAQIKAWPLTSGQQWSDAVRLLWDKAEVREERYAALELLAVSRYRKLWFDPTWLPTLRKLVIEGGWWDYVDNLAANHVGALLRDHPAQIRSELQAWTRDDNLWIRRTSILAQLKFKEATDTEFLHLAISGSLADSDFFARKAIGWALRAYARTDPQWVRDYVATHANELSGLSKREALKHI